MKTTNLKIGTTVLAIALFLVSCNANNESAQTTTDHATHQEEKTDDVLSGMPQTKSEELNALYPHYLALQEALVAGDSTQAKEAALLVEEAGKLVKKGQVIQTAASNILSATTLQQQRDAFSNLSDALITLIKSAGVNEGEFYLAHCPMASNNSGANWISPSKSIKNPYFGDKMLTCGSITETLKKL